MKTILVDDEEPARLLFKYETEDMEEIELTAHFGNGMEALDYACQNNVELAILDIDMNGIDGIELGRRLRKINPYIAIIYLTGYTQYAYEAYKMHAVAYIEKPYSRDELREAVRTAQFLAKKPKKGVYIRTFGHFDVFIDGKPVLFRSRKAKELLALLIDRQGGTVTTEQIIAALWEDRPFDTATQNLCSKTAKTLMKELSENDIDDIIVSVRGLKSVDTTKFECDLYQMLSGDKNAADKFMGEYMMDYSWAEDRMALLGRYNM